MMLVQWEGIGAIHPVVGQSRQIGSAVVERNDDEDPDFDLLPVARLFTPNAGGNLVGQRT
ncbi:hypothetical protein [Variovorax boronicumulans]